MLRTPGHAGEECVCSLSSFLCLSTGGNSKLLLYSGIKCFLFLLFVINTYLKFKNAITMLT